MNERPQPCRCPVYDPKCTRFGRPMTLREYELCSNRCPAERPCNSEDGERLRTHWDAIAADPKLLEEKPAIESPGLLRKGFNFLKAQVEHTLHGRPKASEEEVRVRLEICESCPSELFDPKTRSCKHTSCGCRMDEKVTYADMECPMKHWPETEWQRQHAQKG